LELTKNVLYEMYVAPAEQDSRAALQGHKGKKKKEQAPPSEMASAMQDAAGIGAAGATTSPRGAASDDE
jgi:hypothetical protein